MSGDRTADSTQPQVELVRRHDRGSAGCYFRNISTSREVCGVSGTHRYAGMLVGPLGEDQAQRSLRDD
jgi:hypothetical protein